jgi:sensor histidine kinase regulating citrate/malate metabolism
LNVNADDCDIAGIVGNILNNAIECLLKNMNQKVKRIIFETHVKDNQFIISVANNGSNIPKHNIGKLFDNGFTTKSDTSEHGFGLYITKQLVEKNRGLLSVSSDANGSEFIIEFKLRRTCNGMVSQRPIVENQEVQS